MACLTCEELEEAICALAQELAAAESACAGHRVKEAGIEFDYTSQLTAKQASLKAYQQLWDSKKCGDVNEGLYEFVHTPCVGLVTCEGTSCTPRRKSGRRYRR